VTSQAKPSTGRGLAFLGLLSFIVSFLAARGFATLNPDVVVVQGGIHFHHFWYGLAMIVVSGWLGIVYNRPKLDRVYAVLFGLGGGLVGDEVGLLLTFGNYQSSLTFFFFVVVVALGSAALLFRDRESLRADVTELGRDESVLYTGIVVSGLSALAFANGILSLGLIIIGLGVFLAVVGLLWGRRFVKEL
jgi:hypothetical protein